MGRSTKRKRKVRKGPRKLLNVESTSAAQSESESVSSTRKASAATKNPSRARQLQRNEPLGVDIDALLEHFADDMQQKDGNASSVVLPPKKSSQKKQKKNDAHRKQVEGQSFLSSIQISPEHAGSSSFQSYLEHMELWSFPKLSL